MSEIEELPCPACGVVVPTSGGPARTERVSAGDTSYTSAFSSERTRCECGAELERVVSPGAAWRLTAG